jgi:hypothetical protein
MKTVLIILSILTMAVSCKKEPKLDMPDFALTSLSVTFEAGKEGQFNFEGTAGIISFYSGETGIEYVPEGTATGVNKAITVKGYSDARLTKFTYTYPEKGTYKAFFVAKNINIYGGKEVVRAIAVTVTD